MRNYGTHGITTNFGCKENLEIVDKIAKFKSCNIIVMAQYPRAFNRNRLSSAP